MLANNVLATQSVVEIQLLQQNISHNNNNNIKNWGAELSESGQVNRICASPQFE